MNEETTNASVTNTDVQPTETEIKDKDEQSTQATSQDKPTVDTPVTPTDKTADAAPKDQNQSDTDKPTSQDKPAETKPAQSTAPKEPTVPATSVKPDLTPTKLEQPKKLADVIPTTLVWISGVVGSHQIDCAGPIELPFKLDKPEWPYTTVAPNPAYTNQVFDYDNGAWVATDAKSQGQMLTDLSKKVETLQEDSASHEKSADQTQKMGMQLTQAMTILTTKMTTMEGKLDTLLNIKEKDGDK